MSASDESELSVLADIRIAMDELVEVLRDVVTKLERIEVRLRQANGEDVRCSDD